MCLTLLEPVQIVYDFVDQTLTSSIFSTISTKFFTRVFIDPAKILLFQFSRSNFGISWLSRRSRPKFFHKFFWPRIYILVLTFSTKFCFISIFLTKFWYFLPFSTQETKFSTLLKPVLWCFAFFYQYLACFWLYRLSRSIFLIWLFDPSYQWDVFIFSAANGYALTLSLQKKLIRH